MRILIIDDDYSSRLIFSKILSNIGKCDSFENGLEGKEAFIVAHEQNDPYEIIITDLIMPKLSGIDFVKVVRNYEYSKGIKNSIIAIISGYSDTNNITKKYDVQWLLKPIDIVELSNQVQKLSIQKFK